MPDPSEALEKLTSGLKCVLLAPGSSLLSNYYKDERSPNICGFNLVEKMYGSSELIGSYSLLGFYKDSLKRRIALNSKKPLVTTKIKLVVKDGPFLRKQLLNTI